MGAPGSGVRKPGSGAVPLAETTALVAPPWPDDAGSAANASGVGWAAPRIAATTAPRLAATVTARVAGKPGLAVCVSGSVDWAAFAAASSARLWPARNVARLSAKLVCDGAAPCAAAVAPPVGGNAVVVGSSRTSGLPDTDATSERLAASRGPFAEDAEFARSTAGRRRHRAESAGTYLPGCRAQRGPFTSGPGNIGAARIGTLPALHATSVARPSLRRSFACLCSVP